MTEQFANNASSALNGSIIATDTSIAVTSVTGFPTTGNFRCILGTNASTAEIITVTAVNVGTNTFTTVLRGQEGTTAQSWPNGTSITHILTAGGLGAGTTGGGDISGSVQNATVVKLQGRAVSSTAPTNGYVLAWNTTNNDWEPTEPSAVISTGLILEFSNSASDIATYYNWQTTATGVENDLSVSVTSGGGQVLIAAFATPVGTPDVTEIPAGLWDMDHYAYVNSTSGTSNLVFNFYTRTSGGSETLLFSQAGPAITTTSVAAYTTTYAYPTDTEIPSTDRLVCKVYAETTNASAITVHLVFDGSTHASHVHTPIADAALQLGGDLSGNTSNATVAKINGVALSGTPATGQILTATSSSTASWQAPGASIYRVTPTDSNTQLYWTLDETASPWSNHGNAGALNMTTVLGSPNINQTGLFGQCVDFPNSAAIATSASSVGESSTFTLSCWVYLNAYTSNGCIVAKSYAPSPTWNSPYVATDFSVNSSLDGAWSASLAVSGSRYFTGGTAGNFGIPLNQWTFIASTYDGTTFKSYINGNLSQSTSISGVVDYGTHGQWMAGGIENISGSYLNGKVDDIRFENTPRSQAYLENVYKQGVGLLDNSLQAGPSTTRLTTPDSNTYIRWTLDETSSPYLNTGTAGTLNLTNNVSTPRANQTGLFGQAVAFLGSTGLATASTSLNGSTTQLTVSCWVNMKSLATSFNIIALKSYNASYTSPFNSWGIQQNNSAGQWQVNVAISGVNHSVTVTDDNYTLPTNQWVFLALTYDGTTLSAYFNGNLANSGTFSGTIDYGSNGPYSVGAQPAGGPAASDCLIDELRVETTVRSQSYLEAAYKQGIGLFDNLTSTVQNGGNYGKFLDIVPFANIITTNSGTFVNACTFEFDPTIITQSNGTRTMILRCIAETTNPQLTIQLYNYTAASVVTGSTLTSTSTVPTLLTTGDLSSNLTNGYAIYQVQMKMASGTTTDHITLDMAKLRITWS